MIALKALITGVKGFVGSYLAEYLAASEMEILGLSPSGESEDNIGSIKGRLHLYDADLRDASSVTAIIEEVKPDLVFHLAAQASVSRSWQDPEGTLVNNIVGQLNLLQAVIKADINPRILILGSNEEYGSVPIDKLPVREDYPLRPINPYAVSKVAQDMLGYQYYASHKLQCIRVRPFNHLGPRQSETFVSASFAKQVAKAELGLSEPVIHVGDLTIKRDYTDVRDIVRGYLLLITKGEPGEVYNIGSGRMTTIGAILDFFVRRSKVSLSIKQDPELLRPSDAPATLSDCSKIRSQTGWEPKVPVEQTLADILEYWRERVTKSR